MYVKELFNQLFNEIEFIFEQLDLEQVKEFVSSIASSKRIFITGTGRSLLVGKMFAVRLIQMGFNVFTTSNPLTPSISSKDLLIAISGSGETDYTVMMTQKAKKIGAKIACITAKKDSSLWHLADIKILVPAKTKIDAAKGPFPLGTIFEICTLLVLDGIIPKLENLLNVDESMLKKHHANLE